VDAGGAYVPAALGLFARTVWLVRTTPAWALALDDWLSVGGRHGWMWYDAENARLSIRTNEVELAMRPWSDAATSVHHRFALGFEQHRLESMRVRRAAGTGADTVFMGGVGDTVVRAGYGGELIRDDWALGWDGQIREASLYKTDQQHLRLASRLTFLLAPGHAPFVEGVLFLVRRDRLQGGRALPRASAHAQASVGYDWKASRGVGLAVRGRWLSSFLSGEMPFFELREESLEQQYAEVSAGVSLEWE